MSGGITQADIERALRQHKRAQAIVEAQPEETWDGADEVMRIALERGLEELEKDAGILTPNQLSGGD